MDSHVYQGTAWKTINLWLYNSLLGFDEKGQPTGALAEKWETPDAKTIIFHLRKGVKFHNGQAFTAADVKYSLERILDAATGATLRSNLKAQPGLAVDVEEGEFMNLWINATKKTPRRPAGSSGHRLCHRSRGDFRSGIFRLRHTPLRPPHHCRIMVLQ